MYSLISEPNYRCSAVVCAYNEEKTLGSVIDGLLSNPRIQEILVVNDGSTDHTQQVMAQFESNLRIHAIHLPVNYGKGFALTEGILHASGDILLLVDADLVNWDADHADLMIDALLDQRAGMIIGYPLRRDDRLDEFDRFGLVRALAGERALWRCDLLPILHAMAASRFGAELLINLHYRRLAVAVNTLPLFGLEHPTKLEKSPMQEAMQLYLREGAEILRAFFLHPGLVLQALGLNQNTYHQRVSPTAARARRAAMRWGVDQVESLNTVTNRWKGHWLAQLQND